MKKFLFLLCLTFTAFATLSAQEPSEHMTFKGIPIDGTLNNFVVKLKQKGFTYQGTNDGVALFRGDFAAYKNCLVGVVSQKDKDLVVKVAVMFPTQDKWSELEKNYLSLKNMLTIKYGEPSDCVETFQTYSEPQNDLQKMTNLQLDKCKYQTLFETSKGSIELQITHRNTIECYVMLSYYDAINQKTVMSDAMDDL